MGQVLGGAAWIIGVLLWIISGVVAAVAAAEQWDGVKAGAESFFGLLFLLGIIGAGMINSSGKEGKTQ
jgi:hypothetical protein